MASSAPKTEENADFSPTTGMLIPSDRTLPPVPLKHTSMHASIIGPLCDVLVEQQFQNAHNQPLEALYLFPLPDDAAVTELILTMGDRIVHGEVREREQARRAYAAAHDKRQGAALLEQERANILRVSIANLQPGEQVQVRLRFHSRVLYDGGTFEFVLPTVVLPRYAPADHTAEAGHLHSPLLPEGTRDGHTLNIRVELDVGKLRDLHCPSHPIDVTYQRSHATVTLQNVSEVPNKDFVLRYRVASSQVEAAPFTYRPAGQPGTLLLLLLPQVEVQPEDVLPRELLFVFDRSGSMAGESIVQARNALHGLLRALNPGDTFNIIPFDHKIEQFAPQSLPFTQEHIDRADAYIEALYGRGGTEILKALQTALHQPRDPKRLRVIVFLTDGAVANEDQVLRQVQGSLNEARVYAFGVGSAVNRFLLDKLAQAGRGNVEYILPGQSIEEAVQHFQNRAAFPLLADARLEWSSNAITDIFPTPLPDLYAGQPLTILARFHHAIHTTLRLTGHTTHGRYEQILELDLPEATPDRSEHWAALPQVWARARIDELMDVERYNPREKSRVRDEILGLALEYRLLSPYTAFVAIEEWRDEHTGRAHSTPVQVPIHLPQGTHREVFEPPAQVVYASAMPAAPSMRGRMQSKHVAPDSAARGEFGGGMHMLVTSPEPASKSRVPTGHGGSSRETSRTPAQQAADALRYLARTQAVSGAWADSEIATALALLAFVRHGHSDQKGSFRPQLTRTVRWLSERARQPATSPVVAWALAELAAATGAETHIATRDAALAHAASSDELEQRVVLHAQQTAQGNPQPGGGLPEGSNLATWLADERGILALVVRASGAPDAAAQVYTTLAQYMQRDDKNAGAVVLPGCADIMPPAMVFAATAAVALVAP